MPAISNVTLSPTLTYVRESITFVGEERLHQFKILYSVANFKNQSSMVASKCYVDMLNRTEIYYQTLKPLKKLKNVLSSDAYQHSYFGDWEPAYGRTTR